MNISYGCVGADAYSGILTFLCSVQNIELLFLTILPFGSKMPNKR